MNKKSCTVLLVLACMLQLSFSGNAQKFTTSVSETFKMDLFQSMFKSGDDFITFKETDQKTLVGMGYNLSKAKFGIKLFRYDGAMKLVKENHLSGGDKNFGPFPSRMIKVNDKLWLVYFNYGKEEKNSLNIMAAEINPVSLEIGEGKELLELNLGNTGLSKSVDLLRLAKLIIEPSPDKTKLLVCWAPGLGNEYFISVTDTGLNPAWEKKETVIAGEKIEISSAVVDNNGTVYTTYRINPEKDKYNNYMAISQPKAKTKQIEIKIPGGKPYQALAVASKKTNEVYITGTYATGAAGFLVGVFNQVVSTNDFKAGQIQTTTFSEELVKQLARDKGDWASTKSNKFGLVHLDMRAYALEDGAIAMAGEFIEKGLTGKMHGYKISGCLLNVHFNETGTVIGYIPRYRASMAGTIADSYYASPYKDKLLVFYNDHADNLKLDVSDGSGNYSKSVLVVGSMDKDGKIKRENIMDLTKDDFLPVADAITAQSSSSLLVPANEIKSLGKIGNESKVVTITIE
ncbi:MAG TPA: hypothetical protein VJU78_16035 [Chitinophagaceae bacterium]|nr:hypothetical protein [Chitinophagaceae bacterium]